MAINNPKVVFKVLIIGDAMVGKSCILHRYAEDKFSENITPTIGVDYRPVYRKIGGNLTKLMIWDTAGQEKFKSITMSFYHGAHGAVIVYDVTDKDTLYRLTNWIAELRRICGDIPIVIVGNKSDVSIRNRIPEEEISDFIEEIGYTDRHFMVSALTAENVPEVRVLSASLTTNRQPGHFIYDFINSSKRPGAGSYDMPFTAFEALSNILMGNGGHLLFSEERSVRLSPKKKSSACFC